MPLLEAINLRTLRITFLCRVMQWVCFSFSMTSPNATSSTVPWHSGVYFAKVGEGKTCVLLILQLAGQAYFNHITFSKEVKKRQEPSKRYKIEYTYKPSVEHCELCRGQRWRLQLRGTFTLIPLLVLQRFMQVFVLLQNPAKKLWPKEIMAYAVGHVAAIMLMKVSGLNVIFFFRFTLFYFTPASICNRS